MSENTFSPAPQKGRSFLRRGDFMRRCTAHNSHSLHKNPVARLFLVSLPLGKAPNVERCKQSFAIEMDPSSFYLDKTGLVTATWERRLFRTTGICSIRGILVVVRLLRSEGGVDQFLATEALVSLTTCGTFQYHTVPMQ